MHRPLFAVPALALAVALAGCSSPATTASGDSAPSLDAAPAAGETISGNGYTYALPADWGVPSDVGGVSGFDTLAADLTDDDGFADNVNVVISPAGVITAEQVESQGVDELESAGASDVTVKDRVSVAGAESAHVSARLATQGVEYLVEQYYVSSEDQTYVVTFSFSPDGPEGDRREVAESVLASWSWA
jgi:hypothetical protein